MGKAVKYSAMLRRKSSVAIFKKKVFRGNQNTLVPNTCSSQTQLTNITNREENKNVLSASARKLQSLNKMNISTATTDVDEESTSDVNKHLPSCYFLVDSDILKSNVTIIGACPECKNQKLKQICHKKRDFHCV